MLAGALRVSLRRLEQLDEGKIAWVNDDDVYDAQASGRPLPGRDDSESWRPKPALPEDRGTPLIGRITSAGRAEPDEDWQEDGGRRIPQRFGKGNHIYALELHEAGHSVILRNILVWELREGLAVVYCWNGWEAEGWYDQVLLHPPAKARVVTADGIRHDLDPLNVVRVARVVGHWPEDRA